jgi:hypothetical protein
MMKWILIALAPIILLLLVEELSQWFWKRYMNDSGEKREGKLSTFLKAAIEKTKGWAANLKIKNNMRKNQKDPSH